MAVEVRLTQGSNSPFYYLLATQPLASIEVCSMFAHQDFSTPVPDSFFPTIYFTDHRQLWVHILVVFDPRGKGALSLPSLSLKIEKKILIGLTEVMTLIGLPLWGL